MDRYIKGLKKKNSDWTTRIIKGDPISFFSVFKDEKSARHFFGKEAELEEVYIKVTEIKKNKTE
jgi:hypothetical protein